ncbi:hypothetical protein ACX0HA_08155 [Flavobacterium hauense]
MQQLISRKIDDEEILIRFVYSSDFKKGKIEESSFIEKDFFFDTRGGVSLQRERYSNENLSKQFAKANPQPYAGFVIFKKSVFDELVALHQQKRGEFEAVIKATPLDPEFNIIEPPTEVYTDTPLNPAHADIYYINPANEVTDESVHTYRRLFTKNLFKKSKLLIDEKPDDDTFIDCVFKEIIKS